MKNDEVCKTIPTLKNAERRFRLSKEASEKNMVQLSHMSGKRPLLRAPLRSTKNVRLDIFLNEGGSEYKGARAKLRKFCVRELNKQSNLTEKNLTNAPECIADQVLQNVL